METLAASSVMYFNLELNSFDLHIILYIAKKLFSSRRGEFQHQFFKNSNAWGVAQGGGGGCLSFDLTGTFIHHACHYLYFLYLSCNNENFSPNLTSFMKLTVIKGH